MAILLGRHQIFIEDAALPESIKELNNNIHLCRYFRSLARELDIMEPKTPDGVYKTHLENTRKNLFCYLFDNTYLQVPLEDPLKPTILT